MIQNNSLHARPKTVRSLKGNESGLVAIMVTMIIMGLLTLVTIGFSRLMLREQRQAIDRQLGTQAFYAAESGINDAIKSGAALKNNCDQLQINGNNVDNNLSATDLVSYSCVTVESGIGDIVFDSVSTSESTAFPINANNVGTLTFSWQDVNDGQIFEDGTIFPRLPTTAAWGARTGVLRVTLVPVAATGFNRGNLQALSRTYFLYPSITAGGTIAYSAAGGFAPGYYAGAQAESSNGQIVSGQCDAADTPRMCNVTISGLGATGAEMYYVRLKAIYQPVKVAIQGTDPGGANISLPGAQYVIDSTGKANDVLKRIQVRIPLTSSYSLPEYTVDSASTICKRLIVNPNSVNNSDCYEPFPNVPSGMNDISRNGLD